MEFIEVSAKTVDDAITKACIELQAASDKLEIQVISEGSSGFFGIGSKPAVIRAAVKAAPEKEPEAPETREKRGSSCTGKGSAEKRSCKERNGKKICSASGRNCKTLRAKRRA